MVGFWRSNDLHAGSLWLLKLHGNVDVVGEYIPHGHDGSCPFIRFRALRALLYEPVPPNGVRITNFLYFLLPAGDSEMDIHEKDIVTIVPCPEGLARAYRSAVSGIQIGGKDVAEIQRRMKN